MPRPCAVCTHKDRDAIEAAILDNVTPNRSIALRWGMAHTSVNRHQVNHMKALLEKRSEEEESEDLDRLKKLRSELIKLHAIAYEAAVRATKLMRQNVGDPGMIALASDTAFKALKGIHGSAALEMMHDASFKNPELKLIIEYENEHQPRDM